METLHLDLRSLATGDQTVDRQHEEIFRRAGSLRTAVEEGRGAEEVVELLAFLDDYTQLHFSSEELLMEREGFPALAGHRREHVALLGAIRLLEQELRVIGPTPAMVARVNQVIFRRFIQHIQQSDQAFAGFVRGKAQSAR